MYDYLDRGVSSLGLGARFSVWAMRGWVAAIQNRQCPCKALSSGFRRWHVEDALPHLSMALAILNCESHEKRVFRAPCHPRVSEDEALLLDLLAKAGTPAGRTLRATLDLMVADVAVGPLAIALESAAAALADKGLRPAAPDIAGASL